MSFLSRAFTGVQEQRVVTSSHLVPTIDEDIAMQGTLPGNSMALPAFSACVTLLADSISSMTGYGYRKNGAARTMLSPQPILVGENSPYPETTWFEWLWMVMELLATTGNAPTMVTARDKYHRPTALMPLHPGVLQVDIDKNDPWPSPKFRVDGTKVSADDIVIFKRYPVAGSVFGMSIVEKAAASLGLGLAAQQYGLSYFRDAASPSSVLETDQSLDPEAARDVMRRWVASHGGRRKPAVLSGGLKWKPIAIAPNEAQFLETRQFQRSDIAMLFRVPPHMIGDNTKSTSWGTGIEQMSIGFLKFTLKPWLTCIEQIVTAQLPRGQFFKFNIDGLLRGDVKSRWEAYRLGRETGVYSVDEIRAFEDLGPVENGDIRLQPMNYAPLGYEPPEKPDDSGDSADDTEPEPEPDTEPEDDPNADDEGDEEDDK